MNRLWALPLILAIAFDILGPAVVLLLVKRRTGRWRPAAVACLLTATVGAFLLTGTVCWVTTVVRASVTNEWRTEALMTAFPVPAIYGVLFATTGLLFTLPLVGLWRLVHAPSFRRITRECP
jgi:hypothetical protein